MLLQPKWTEKRVQPFEKPRSNVGVLFPIPGAPHKTLQHSQYKAVPYRCCFRLLILYLPILRYKITICDFIEDDFFINNRHYNDVYLLR